MKLMLITAVTLLISCTVTAPPVEKPTEQLSPCQLACDNLEKLGCEESKPDANGVSCVILCQETMAGRLVDLEPDRVALITECP